MQSFGGIQVMRGVAASTVLIGHASMLQNGMGLPYLSRWYLTIFPAGVDIFFVISGFIITHALASRKPTSWHDALEFAFRRITRLYPLYWIVLLVSMLASQYVPISTPDFKMASPIELITASASANWYVPPAWTLAFEVYFYSIITCIIALTPRYVFPCMAIWFAGQAVAAALWTGQAIHTHALIMEFGFGSFICYLVLKGISGFLKLSLGVSAVFFLVGATLAADAPLSGWVRVSTYGVGAAFLIYAMAIASVRGVRFPRPLIYLGNASFSIYIWHYGLFAAMVQACEWMGILAWWQPQLRPLLLLMWIAAAFAVGLASYHLLERPLLRLSRKGLRSPRVLALR
jgi:exopolysaccharide production protein ExoZ